MMATDGTDRHRSSANGWESTESSAHLRGRRVRDTEPELRLRHTLHALGLRYRLDRKIGGFRPDLTFRASRTVIFVDGCFWHGCPEHGPRSTAFRGPNAERWQAKLAANRARDERAMIELELAGWLVIRVWECEVKRNVTGLAEQIRTAIGRRKAARSS